LCSYCVIYYRWAVYDGDKNLCRGCAAIAVGNGVGELVFAFKIG